MNFNINSFGMNELIAFAIGVLIVVLIWVVVSIFRKRKNRKEYTISDLRQKVYDAHDDLNEAYRLILNANTTLIELAKAFIEIENDN